MRLSLNHILATFLLFPLLGWGQVTDELTLPIGTQPAVGVEGADFMAQSFRADVRTIRTIGVWLRTDSLQGEVRVALWGDDGNGNPNPSAVYYQGAILNPSPITLTAYVDSSLSIPVIPGQTYHVVVDGRVSTSGFSVVGYSGNFTDTGRPMQFSLNNGTVWDSIANKPMAIRVEGDTCATTVTLFANRAEVCPGDTVTLYVNQNYDHYAWSTGDTVFFTNITQPGTYTVAVVDGFGCGAADTVTLAAGSPVITGLDSAYYACDGGTFSLTANPGYFYYQWSTGDTSRAISVLDSGEVWVFVQDLGGCSTIDTVSLVYYPNPTTYIGPDTGICQGQFLIVDGGPGFGAYLWDDGQTTRTIVVNTSDTVAVQVIDSTGCTGWSNMREILVHPLPVTPQITQQGDFLFSTSALQYQWYLDGVVIPGADNISYAPTANGNYQVEVANGFGCTILSDTFSITSYANPNFIPQGFSPNGDGINDVFEIGQIEFYPENEIHIYNRWGKAVFSEKPYRNNWFGQGPGGISLPTGNYFYVLDLGNGTPIISGVIFLQK